MHVHIYVHTEMHLTSMRCIFVDEWVGMYIYMCIGICIGMYMYNFVEPNPSRVGYGIASGRAFRDCPLVLL